MNKVLFPLALLGCLAMVGLLLASLGWPFLAAYLVLLALVAWRCRPVREAEGRTCTCCTSTVYDPVEVR